jgi:hypothetical protein
LSKKSRKGRKEKIVNRTIEANPADANLAQNPPAELDVKLEAYWCLDDTVCRQFLTLGMVAADFEAVKLFFPYVREVAACQTPRGRENVGTSLYYGFYAGHELGCRHPELAEQILPGVELKEALRRLGILIQCAKETHLSSIGLNRACTEVAASHRPSEPTEDADSIAGPLLLKTMRAGVAAGTAAQMDPALSDALGNFGKPIAPRVPDILDRALVMSAVRIFEEGFAARPWHPLLRLTRELYPEHSLEGRTVLEFVDQRLQQYGMLREEDTPWGELDLVDWIAGGLEYGRRVRRKQPQLVADIFKECEGERLEAAKSVVHKAVTRAGRVAPYKLIRPLLDWYKSVHCLKDPGFYGERVARVGAIADFAVWIPWVAEDKPPKRSGRRSRPRKSGNTVA